MPGMISASERVALRLLAGVGQSVDPLRTVTARDDLVRRLEDEFDLELLDEAVDRVRQRVTAPTWEAFRLTAWSGATRGRGGGAIEQEGRHGLCGPQQSAADAAG